MENCTTEKCLCTCKSDFTFLSTNFRRFQPLIFPKIYAMEDNQTKNMFPEIDYKEKLKKEFSQETGYDRVRKMYSKNEFGLMSPDLLYIIQGTYIGGAIAALISGFSAACHAKTNFFRANVATTYESKLLARRHLSDQITRAVIKTGFKSGLKFGLSAGAYLLTTMTAATYNNKITIYEHVASGVLLGSLARINYGLKGIAVAGCLGGFLGTLAGGIILLSVKLSGCTYEELRYLQHDKYWKNFYSSSANKQKSS